MQFLFKSKADSLPTVVCKAPQAAKNYGMEGTGRMDVPKHHKELEKIRMKRSWLPTILVQGSAEHCLMLMRWAARRGSRLKSKIQCGAH